jgi:phosphoribosyl-ATP pyrophosphohydrolase
MEINDLYAIICERRDHPSAESYTARLMSLGEDEIVKKVGEEAVEVILAAKGQGDQRLVEEISDLTYHVLTLMAYRHISPDQIREELEKRHKPKPAAGK